VASELSEFVDETAKKFDIPGVAAGVWAEGEEASVCRGVTSVENPLPIDRDTLFGVGSISKTFTASALLRLVAEGTVDLEAPVRQYVPALKLMEEQTAAEVTVLQLLNHTSGLDWGLQVDTGEGDDALAIYVAKMDELAVIAPVGGRVSYSQGGYNLAGRIIEKVTGATFEDAVASLIFEPLGLAHSFYRHEEVLTRRFTVAHNRGDDGTLSVLRMRRRPRGDNPGGGLASSLGDLSCWARFHLGDGRSESGARVLPTELLRLMQEPTVALRGSNLGDAIGICWFLREIDGVRTVGHGGSTNGQFAELLLVPERNFAVVALSNAGPDGVLCNQAIVGWALEQYLGLRAGNPEPLPFDEARAREIVGKYENDVMTLTVDSDGAGLRLEVLMKPETRAAYKEAPPDHDPFEFGLLPGDRDEYIINSGAFNGQRGFFTRDNGGSVAGVDLAGRLFTRVAGGNVSGDGRRRDRASRHGVGGLDGHVPQCRER
jgi:CubicO group peptidase (beta-lactamase class C family)